MNIPFCDLRAGYLLYKEEFDAAYKRVMESGHYILGPECDAFETEFAQWNNMGHCVGVANGTDAVELALRGSGVEPGDMVATPSHTAVATVAAIERCGAVPVFTDIDQRRFTMSPESLQRVLEAWPIKAVVPVHLYGQCADMNAIMPLAAHHGCMVIEDCAQAHGATLAGRKAGTFGNAAAFSFYPTKNLGAFGDGGAILTDSGEIAARIRSLRQYGWQKRYISATAGCNSRLDELQAAFLHIRLRHLEAENNARRKLAAMYMERLAGIDAIALPDTARDCDPVWHLFVIMTDPGELRDRLISCLGNMGIPLAIHYPEPVHLQPAYRGRVKADPLGLPATEAVCARIVSLPMYAAMPPAHLEKVCAAMRNIFASKEE